MNRFVAAVSFAGNNLDKLPTGLLTPFQMEFLGTTIKKVGDYYQKGVMITGKEKIFSGKEVSDEERISLAGNLLGAHIQKAFDNGVGITDAVSKGLAGFITDMVVDTPKNVVKDASTVTNYALQTLANRAIKAYSSVVKTESGYYSEVAGKIIKDVTLPLDILEKGMGLSGWVTVPRISSITSF
ncbi:MAG: hypothetical protein AB1422_07350 [bacterium]